MVNPMCDYFGCIITKDLKVHWSKRTFAHEDLLSELKLEDKNLEAREFIRVEILPNDKACMTRNREDWTFKVDEEKTLPNWYEKNVIQCRKLCWEAWEQSVQVNLALGKEEKTVTDTMIFAYDSSTVEAYGSSKVEAYDSSKVVAHGFSKVEIKSDTTVVLCHQKIFVSEKATVVRASVVKAAEV